MRSFVPMLCAGVVLFSLARPRACFDLATRSPGSLERAHAEPSAVLAPAPGVSPGPNSSLETAAPPAVATPLDTNANVPAASPSLDAPTTASPPSATADTQGPTDADRREPSAPPELNDLLARMQALERIDPLDESVRRPIDFARAALERSRASRARGDSEAEARTQKLGRAAVELAEARLRLLRERALLHAVQARHSAALAEQATAKQALEHERARALELQREGALP